MDRHTEEVEVAVVGNWRLPSLPAGGSLCAVHWKRLDRMVGKFRSAMGAIAMLFAGMPGIGVSSELNESLVCSDESVRDYQRIQVLAGRMIVSPVPNAGTSEQHSLIHENFQDMSFDDGKTYFIVAHKESGELFTSDCAAQTCSFEEVSEPNAQCEMMNYLGGNMDSTACMFFAVRFQDENFCLQQPSITP